MTDLRFRYHLHFNPDREQLYQLSQLAVSMAVDLGINKPAPRDTTREVVAFMVGNSASLVDSAEVLEAKRTFIGCYYVSSL